MAETKATAPKYEPPAGMDRVGLPSLDGWWDGEAKTPVHGKLLGEFRQKNKTGGFRWIAIIGLFSEANVTIGAGREAKKTTLPRGKIVGVGVKHKLQDLLTYAPGTEVWILPLEKKSIGGGQTMWEFDMRVKEGSKKKTRDELELMRQRKPMEETGGQAPASDESDDDIPF